MNVEDYNSNNWIFTGTLIKETGSGESSAGRAGFYKIVRAYKGVVIGDTVVIYDSEYVSACGLGCLSIGREYLIFAVGDEKKWTNSCSRTTRVPVNIWPRDSIMINKQKTLTSFGRIYDTIRTNFHADTTFLAGHVLKIISHAIQTFYEENGNISATGEYKNGLPEGFWSYYQDGKIVNKGKYVLGKKDSLWVESNPFTNEMYTIREYKNGEFTHREISFAYGKIYSKTEPLVNNKKWVEYHYHSNGKVRFIAETNPPFRDTDKRLENGLWDGSFIEFNKAGIPLEKGMHKNGLPVGHWKYYYEYGKLRMEGDYVEGKKMGVWKIYYPNQKIKATGNYIDDEKSGNWNYYTDKAKAIPADPKLIEEDEDPFTY
ncbi:MAG: toxin-antitoxin system YwqK family antitoxin [Taibaiella sp.]|nr:toxin-antitoxin system YwqK family antitoxin [Taibaiella sp.]